MMNVCAGHLNVIRWNDTNLTGSICLTIMGDVGTCFPRVATVTANKDPSRTKPNDVYNEDVIERY